MITLDNSTRIDNAYEFANISQVPRLAITMGISTILQSKKIFLMAWGSSKAAVIKKAAEDDDTEQVPASLLQNHDDVTFVVDETAASELTRNKSPWLTGDCDWSAKMIKKAVVNMALKLKKPVLSLTNTDYNEYGLSDLLVDKGDAYEINLQVYYMLRDSITGWPGGKPNVHLPTSSRTFITLSKKGHHILSLTRMMILSPWAGPFNDYMTRAMMYTWATRPAGILR
jgi:glucosamine-6-phosphate deaminase